MTAPILSSIPARFVVVGDLPSNCSYRVTAVETVKGMVHITLGDGMVLRRFPDDGVTIVCDK